MVLDVFSCGSFGLGCRFSVEEFASGVLPESTAGILSKVRPCDHLPRKMPLRGNYCVMLFVLCVEVVRVYCDYACSIGAEAPGPALVKS